MNRQSIFFTLTVSFILSLVLVIISFTALLKSDYQNEIINQKKRYFPIARLIHRECYRDGLSKDLADSVKNAGMKLISKKSEVDKILSNDELQMLSFKSDRRLILKLYRLQSSNYLFVQTPKNRFLIHDERSIEENNRLYIFIVFAVVLLTIILSFLATMKKLYPLRRLKDKVKTLGDEDFDFECCGNIESNDEVSQLAREFQNSAKKLKNIKDARNVFIRNIMHELKTPITKGKFLAELPATSENREKFKKVFYRLESLINEFASIEELISINKEIEKKAYYVADLVDNAVDIMMLDDDNVITDLNNSKVKVNFKLFTIAIKNLIDNAVKYSDDKKVIIEAKDSEIVFMNRGKEIQRPLEEYFEPFLKGDKFDSESFGLGLYIVNNILKANNYRLEYEYSDGMNIFKCVKAD